MNIIDTGFKSLFLLEHNVYCDKRGVFKEIYRKDILEEKIGYQINFCQDNNVKSSFMVLRGLHFQKQPSSQSKLVSVLKGEILDVAVDIRKKSATYGKYFSIVLSSEKNKSIFIPKGFAHGYLTLSESAIINYKVDNYYNRDLEQGILYNDEYLNIDWTANEKDFIISEKDKKFPKYKW